MRGGPRPPQGGKKGEPQGKGAQQDDAQRAPEHDKGPQGKGGAPEHQGRPVSRKARSTARNATSSFGACCKLPHRRHPFQCVRRENGDQPVERRKENPVTMVRSTLAMSLEASV